MSKIEHAQQYIDAHPEWQPQLTTLRGILNNENLEETIKWGVPVYCLNGKNVVGLAAFKSYVGLWFYQGALLKDERNLLINAQKDKTKALRQMRFDALSDIDASLVATYLQEAIDNQRQGKQIKVERNKPLNVPDELQHALDTANLSAAFAELTKGKQREYAEHIASAKRDATKQSRLDNVLPMIAARKGLYDKYKNC